MLRSGKPLFKYLLISLVFVFMLFLNGCGNDDNKPSLVDKPEEVVKEALHCPLDDEFLGYVGETELNARVLVFSIDNLKAARPQKGISEADIMYEVPAEGGVSRLLAVFYHGTTETVGPVRSARPYMIDIAREWDGVFVHCGGSNDAFKYLGTGVVDYLNEISAGSYFWRDKSRRAPHNLFTSTANIYDYILAKEKQSDQVPRAFLFWEDGEVPAGGEIADLIKINYPSAKNTYKYDSQTGLYSRYINDQPHIDANNEQQIQAANIIVQKVSSKVLDSAGRLSINLVGSGEAMLFSGGTVRIGTWQKASLDDPTYFYDADGSEWKLAGGQTWIQVTDQTVNISYENTQPPVDELESDETVN